MIPFSAQYIAGTYSLERGVTRWSNKSGSSLWLAFLRWSHLVRQRTAANLMETTVADPLQLYW